MRQSLNLRRYVRTAIAVTLLATATLAIADEARDAALAQRDQVEQLERWRRDRERIAAVQGKSHAATWMEPVLAESPCHVVYYATVTARTADPNQYSRQAIKLLGPVQHMGRFEGACLGAQSIDRLRSNLQARLDAAGYITTRLSIPAQDLSWGVLTLEAEAGYVEAIKIDQADNALSPNPNSLAFKVGDLLNLRDIEHTLENLARLPSMSSRFLIEPGSEAGGSVVRIVPAGEPRWRGSIGLDSTDGDEYGAWQTSAQGTVDGLANVADQLSLSVSSAETHKGGERPYQHTWFAHWSVPFGRHLASISASSAKHRRYFAGGVGRFSETGRDGQVRLRWQWTPWRSALGRVSLWAATSSRRAQTYIDDIELLGRRRIGDRAELGSTWWIRHLCGELTLDGEGSRVTRLQRDNDFQLPLAGRPRQWQLNAQWNCRPTGANWDLNGSLSIQRISRPVDGTDLVVVGSRQTVRGHALPKSLSGQGATVVRNELGFPLWQLAEVVAVRPWLGIDWGRVHKPISEERLPSELTGVAVGARWQASRFSGELSAAWPVVSGPPTGAARWSASLRAAF